MPVDNKTKEPVCRPLSSLQEVLDWSPDTAGDVVCVPTLQASSQGRRHTKQHRPRMLLCHDMAGGYLDDRYLQGVPSVDCYRFYHWSQIDTFVYFSHHFVTIPPPCWTSAAHTHGVQVLGTIITEWDEGKAHCEQFLVSHSAVDSCVSQLVSLAIHYSFDGWLINIENVIAPELMDNLVYFVRTLTERMRDRVPGSLVLWYDSVITTGQLKWQDELNDLNKVFFDQCDGIFLNYCWKSDSLEHSVTTAGPQCQHHVYVGVDVFGRGCLGGGGYNTCEALTEIRKHNLSVALFAPGWVWEKHDKQQFCDNQNRFWELLQCSPITDRPLYEGSHFVSTFCQGWGYNYYHKGQVTKEGAWTNLSLQSPQPSLPYPALTTCPGDPGNPSPDATTHTETLKEDHVIHSYCTDTAYSGGGCLKLHSTLKQGQQLGFDLFSQPIMITPYSTDLCISLTYRSLGTPDTHVSLHMTTQSHTDTGGTQLHDLKLIAEPEVQEQQAQGWSTQTYKIEEPACTTDPLTITSVQVLLSSGLEGDTGDTSDFSVLLGQLKIYSSGPIHLPPASTQLSATDIQYSPVHPDSTDASHDTSHDTATVLSCSLHWEYTVPDQEISTKVRHYNICYKLPTDADTPWKCIGHTTASLYRVHDLKVKGHDLEVKVQGQCIEFCVQPLLVNGELAPCESWAECKVSLKD